MFAWCFPGWTCHAVCFDVMWLKFCGFWLVFWQLNFILKKLQCAKCWFYKLLPREPPRNGIYCSTILKNINSDICIFCKCKFQSLKKACMKKKSLHEKKKRAVFWCKQYAVIFWILSSVYSTGFKPGGTLDRCCPTSFTSHFVYFRLLTFRLLMFSLWKHPFDTNYSLFTWKMI